MDIIKEESKDSLIKSSKTSIPREIFDFLDICNWQHYAKKAIAVAVYNHYKRLNHKPSKSEVELAKSNILLIGSTGSGKTLLAQTSSKIFRCSFYYG